MSGISKFIVSIASVVIGLIFGALLMFAFGYDPITGYESLYQGAFGNPFSVGQTVRAATPLIFTGLGFAVAYTAGFFNIGLAGQALWGWFASVWVGLMFPNAPIWIVLPLAIVTGALAGALWAAIAGVLKAYFNTSEVIVTIMLNYISIYIVDYLIRYVLTDKADRTPSIGANASLKIAWLSELTNNSTIHGGVFLAIVAAIIVAILMARTVTGFELKSVGLNPHASNYAGMSAKKNIILAMCISGALAGLGGVMNGLGEFGFINLQNGVAPAIGFNGMAVALLGINHPIGIIFAAFLFGALETGASTMALFAKIPSEIVDIVIGIIIFFVGANYIITYFLERSKKRKSLHQSKLGQEGGEL
ncbi:ABC transporter permease [Facklamia sp. DSM 111018]|uniref:ABC transporter permease n=1 Tax=Facklamia lactis TaxID=2749967 RepID=A0ABS0LNY3_9LACT|nr:ABC transporter permease [Facklamia lactis]MBG9980056.1 ABC transporter permease [Facklamia lactis]MBG9985858.1 ABC transporter permease [Facklamia lactis]